MLVAISVATASFAFGVFLAGVTVHCVVGVVYREATHMVTAISLPHVPIYPLRIFRCQPPRDPAMTMNDVIPGMGAAA